MAAALAAPTRLGPGEIEAIAALVPLAPLHNAPALAAIRWFARQEPAWPQAAGFDTAFHRSLPRRQPPMRFPPPGVIRACAATASMVSTTNASARWWPSAFPACARCG
jgi:hypothetical protein